jgi:hypothetical protein
MKSSTIIYSLNVEDIQRVAVQEIERNVSPEEIEKITKSITDKINWYDAIANSINEKIKV